MSFFNQDSLTSLLRSLSSYRYGDSRAVIADLNEFIRGMDDIPEARLRMESQFAGFLRGDATLDAKQFICQKLALLGTEQCYTNSGMTTKIFSFHDRSQGIEAEFLDVFVSRNT